MSKKPEMFTPNDEPEKNPDVQPESNGPAEPVKTEKRPARFLEVYEVYQGRLTNEQPINPAIYQEGDPALFGCEDRLIEVGAARWVHIRG